MRAQLLRDHLRVEVSTNNHDNDLLIQQSFSPLKPFANDPPPQKSFYRIDDGALVRDSMKLPCKKGVERAPPEAT